VPEKMTKVQLPTGALADAVEVGVSESIERWTDVKLDDGSTLRIKTVILGAVRLEGQYDQEGNPMYMVKANQVMTVSAPDHLRKDGGGITRGVH
jgi:hypothetical protein